ASGGMGDVLTGMLTAFLAQGYAPSDAAVIACYLHGRTGDRLATDSGMAVVPAGVLVHTLSSTLGTLLPQRSSSPRFVIVTETLQTSLNICSFGCFHISQGCGGKHNQ